MVALIEDQIHQFLIDQEEKRCAAIEPEYSQNEKATRKKIKRKKIPKPWTRPSQWALCQESELLLTVDKYDYDLADEMFQAYCEGRGILYVAGTAGSRRWDYLAEYSKSKCDFLADSYFQFSEEVNGKRYRYADEEMETHWKIMLLGRAKLQDCWELFCMERSEQK